MHEPFTTGPLAAAAQEVAPDGSAVRPLLRTARASIAEFTLRAGTTSRAVAHRRVDEVWYVLAGEGRLWRRQGTREQEVALTAGVIVSIPAGTRFQFRAGAADLSVLGVTMPPWPVAQLEPEAFPVEGVWEASASTGIRE